MTKTLRILLALCILGPYANAQNWLGIMPGNYSGIHGIYMNPASIADSRTSLYVNLMGFNANINNNYLYLQSDQTLFSAFRSSLAGNDNVLETYFKEENLHENLNGKKKYASFSTELRGPGVMFTIGRKSSIAIGTRLRAAAQVFDMDESFARLLRWGTDSNSAGYKGSSALQYGVVNEDNRFSINANVYSEYSATYAREIFDWGRHYLKGGVTLKMLNGGLSYYVYNKGIKYEIVEEDSLNVYNYNFDYGYIDPEFYQNTNATDYLVPGKLPGRGFGLDIGAVYEYRPNYTKYQYQMNGKTKMDPSKNKYLFRISGSVMDIGSIKYKKPGYITARSYSGNNPVYWNLDNYLDSIPDQGDRSQAQYIDSVLSTTFPGSTVSDHYTSKLPTVINLNLDYRIIRNVYVNVMFIQSIRKKASVGYRTQSVLGITPRFESRWFDASVPVVVSDDYRNLQIGLAFRAGPVYFGSDNVYGLLAKNQKVYGADFYAGLSIPIYARKERDKDKDGISNRKDKCRSVPGVWAFQGCPDTDNDSIPDSKDECPTVAGLAKFNGCPDSDNDGIVNQRDSCPLDSGIAELNGCPDADGDKIADAQDSCPTVAGLAQFNGCPDADGDGVYEPLDKCPAAAGLAIFDGCPDTDMDSIPDPLDRCPTAAGPAHTQGCPDMDKDGIADPDDKCPIDSGSIAFNGCPDRDGDNVPDYLDMCPLTFGPPANNGCPQSGSQLEIVELSAEEEQVLKEAFDNLEFETGKSVISASSYISLDELVTLMEKKPSYRIYVAGHTDNVGNAKSNLKLSKARANAVKTYLISKKVDAHRIIAEGFGQNRPVASNATAEGRQRNRRVEFRVVK